MDIVLYGLLPVSPVLFARHATGSFAWASIVLGADTAGTVIAAPARGRLLDLTGPRAALLGLVCSARRHRAGRRRDAQRLV